MADKIRVGIVGYGNLGQSAVKAVRNNPDFELAIVFTTREPEIIPGITMVPIAEMGDYQDAIDVMLMCGSSANELPSHVPMAAAKYVTIDAFDTHAKIPAYFDAVDRVARTNDKLAMISCGWDPGLFSIMRVAMESFLPTGNTHTFWGRGVSQGHSEVCRRVEGVLDARQYTVPVEETLAEIREGNARDYSMREMHKRECFIVAREGADREKIAESIRNTPDYFAPYDTSVEFIDKNTMQSEHRGYPHGGSVIRAGRTGDDNRQLMELSVKLDSNPEFTSSILVAFARAVWRMYRDGRRGAVTVLDTPIGYLSPKDPAELRAHYL